MSLRRLPAGCLLLALVACGTPPSEGEADDGASAQEGALPDALGSIEGDAVLGTRIAVVGASRYALHGARVGELVIGKRYSLTLARSSEPDRDGLPMRELVDFRVVKHLTGTLSDDVNDPEGMILTSVHARTYSLHGETVATYKEIRASLPAHDYARTLFEVNLVEDKSPSTRFEWLDYRPIPHVRCAQRDAERVHLDLVDVRPDESLLDGFITIPMGPREVRYGAHAECTRDATVAPAYTCALESAGSAWGTARLAPVADGPFDLVVDKRDATRVTFSCEVVRRDAVAATSED